MVVENLIGQATEVLSEVVPFAGSAIKILRMILGQTGKEEAER
jgi:hypothetical protein